MTAPSKVHPSTVRPGRSGPRRYPVSDGQPVEVIEDGPSIQARLVSIGHEEYPIERDRLAQIDLEQVAIAQHGLERGHLRVGAHHGDAAVRSAGHRNTWA